MSGPVENLLGEIPVVARLTVGVEKLRLLVTDRRIIAAHLAKRGTGGIAATTLLGKIGAGFEELVKGGKDSLVKRRLRSLTPEEILQANRDNFAIAFEEVVNFQVIEQPYGTQMVVLTTDDKFEFSTEMEFQTVVGLLENGLGPKLETKKLEVTR